MRAWKACPPELWRACREAYAETLLALGREHPEIVALDADVALRTGSWRFGREFPERFFDMGIAEQNMLGVAAGLAACGKIPFVSAFAVFASGRAFDQFRQQIAYPRLNVKVIGTHAGVTVGKDGPTHQAAEDLALMRVLPNVTIISPADAIETREATKALLHIPGPVYMRLGRDAVPVLFDEGYRFQLGKAMWLREGKQAAIVGTGAMVWHCLEAADALAQEGLEVGMLNLHTLKPLDKEALLMAAETGALVTVEDHSIIGGLGGAVAEVLSEERPTPMVRVGLQDCFAESGAPADLLETYGMSQGHIAAAVRKAIAKREQGKYSQRGRGK